MVKERLQVTTLPNGLRVVTEVMPHVATAAVGMWVGAGARHEADGEHGLAHLLEHMAFKGTGRRSARDIAEAVEALGGEFNAETGVEHTSYSMRLMGADVGIGIEILADILTDSQFDEAELEREKNVILQEIGAVDDTPDDLATDVFLETAFREQALGRSILGTGRSVKGLGRAQIQAYLAGHYRGPNMVLAAAGAVEHERVVEEAQRLLAGIAAAPAGQAAPASYSGGEAWLDRDLEQTHVLLGFKGASFHAPEIYTVQVFAHLLGGGMSSRLFQEVREERGLAYSVDAFHWGFADTGLFGMSAGTAPEDTEELLSVLASCLRDAAQSLSAAEVDRARAQLKVAHLSALEAPMSRADQLARQLLSLGRILPHQEVIEKLEAVTVEGVRFAGKSLMQSAATFTAIGPVGALSARSGFVSQLMQGA